MNARSTGRYACIYGRAVNCFDRQRKVLALDDVVSDLEEGTGPTDCGGGWWMRDALTDHSSEFIEQLHDKIIDLEDNLLDQQIPPRGFSGSAAQTINCDASLYGTAT